jgi:hypothetical protein
MMIPRLPAMAFHFRRHFSSFVPRCETTSLLFYRNLASLSRFSTCARDKASNSTMLENNSVTYLLLWTTEKYTKSSAEAMARYMRTSKRLQRIRWKQIRTTDDRALQQREEMVCCFHAVIHESTSLKELDIDSPREGDGPSNLALENMLAHTQSLQSLRLRGPDGPAVTAARSGLKKNTTLLELTLTFPRDTTISPILTSVHDHPLLRRLCLRGYGVDLTGLKTLSLSDASKIKELDIHNFVGGPAILGWPHVLQALARLPRSPSWDYAAVLLVSTRRDCSGWHCVTC